MIFYILCNILIELVIKVSKKENECNLSNCVCSQCAGIMAKGNFTTIEVVKALNDNAGNDDAALLELQKNQLKPFLMRIWGPPAGVENEEAAPRVGKSNINFYVNLT